MINQGTMHGLGDLPTTTYPDREVGALPADVRVIRKLLHTFTSRDAFDSLDRLKELCDSIPVHSIHTKS